ncbi:MAG: hypothetical protein IH934_00130 [Nanoarchaeota archaeon]|nr:hypothetical protein [Nanoarchaeota archaeon]
MSKKLLTREETRAKVRNHLYDLITKKDSNIEEFSFKYIRNKLSLKPKILRTALDDLTRQNVVSKHNAKFDIYLPKDEKGKSQLKKFQERISIIHWSSEMTVIAIAFLVTYALFSIIVLFYSEEYSAIFQNSPSLSDALLSSFMWGVMYTFLLYALVFIILSWLNKIGRIKAFIGIFVILFISFTIYLIVKGYLPILNLIITLIAIVIGTASIFGERTFRLIEYLSRKFRKS